MTQVTDLKQQVTLLLKKAQVSTEILSLVNCLNGGNNRGYLLETTDGSFFVKQYFRQAADERDRLKSEFAFLSYATKAAPRFVPRPYSQDEENGLALYEYIQGKALVASEIDNLEITQAIDFFGALNQASLKQQALSLPLASEAGFSIQEHVSHVARRVDKLQQAIQAMQDEEAKTFIRYFQSHWQRLLTKIQQQAQDENLNLHTCLPMEQRCISPSDFGFHNALKKADGRVCFLDFEYAGWDDPAKMVSDFFLQLAVPIEFRHYDRFLQKVLGFFPQLDYLTRRAKLLHEICRVKWCCIALNVYIPVHLARRQFANPGLNALELKKEQLKKAEKLLSSQSFI